MVKSYANETPRRRWGSEGLAHFIFERYEQNEDEGETTDSAFWYLIIMGFMTFKEITGWEDELYWANAVEHVLITPQGEALLDKLERLTESESRARGPSGGLPSEAPVPSAPRPFRRRRASR